MVLHFALYFASVEHSVALLGSLQNWFRTRTQRDAYSTDADSEDLSADGPVAQRIRAALAAQTPLPNENFRIGDAGSRGLGLFVADDTVTIPAQTFLMDYEGLRLEQAGFDERYPTGSHEARYAVGIPRPDGSTVYIDAALPRESPTLESIGTAPLLTRCHPLLTPVLEREHSSGKATSPAT